jgi:hypothetical protein
MTTRQDLIIRQGETWSYVYTKHNAAGVAVDLTGYSARMAIKDCYNGAQQAYLSTGADAWGGSITLGGIAGTVTLSMTAAQAAALAGILNQLALVPQSIDYSKPTVTWLYDLELVSGAGVVTRELQGRVEIQREVTA